MKHIQEEKLSLALFHHHRLGPFWKETLNEKISCPAVSNSTILDPGSKEIPPGAYLDGPKVAAKSLLNGLIWQKHPKRRGTGDQSQWFS